MLAREYNPVLFAYRTGVIRATENFMLGVTAATGGILLVYAASWILGFFGIAIGPVRFVISGAFATILISVVAITMAIGLIRRSPIRYITARINSGASA